MKIAVASGKGGTGKTTISTNLASFIAETEKVVLSDLDVEEWGREHPNPKRPHYLMLMKTMTYIPEEWKQYLFY